MAPETPQQSPSDVESAGEHSPDTHCAVGDGEPTPTTGAVWPPLPACQVNLPRLPLSALPRWLEEVAKEHAEQHQLALDAVAFALLVGIGAAAAKRVGLRVGESVHTTHLWGLISLPTGEGKSPLLRRLSVPFSHVQRERRALADAREPERRVEARLLIRDRGPIERRLLTLRALPVDAVTDAEVDERRDLEARLIGLERVLAEVGATQEPTLLVEDTTPQALLRMLAENNGVLTMISDEGSQLLRSVSGPTVLGEQVEGLLKVYSGEDIRVSRVSRPPVQVAKPALGMLLATQPPVLRRVLRSGSFAGRGFWERFLYLSPPSMVGRRREPGPLDRYAVGKYDAMVQGLLSHPVEEEPGRLLRLSGEARAMLSAYCAGIDRRMGEGDLSVDPMRGWAGKLRENCIRLTTILHLAGTTTGDEVSAEAIEVASAILDTGVAHARYILETLPGEEDDEGYLLG